MATLLEDMLVFLESNGHGSTAGTSPSLRALWVADEPDAMVSVFDYAGLMPQHTLDGRAWQMPRLQVLVRDPDPIQCAVRAQAVHDDLDDVVGQDINGTHYLSIDAQANAAFLQRDEELRTIYVVNFQCWRA